MIERSPQRLDPLAREHCSHGFDRHGDDQWYGLPNFTAEFLNRKDAGFDIASVLAGLEEKQIDATFNEAAGLLQIVIAELFERDAARDTDGFGSGTHRTGDEAGFRGRGKLIGDFPCQLC